ncbi:MAG: transcription antitermination factor NusB [Parachlamydiales bacterium]|nr:transcription antitermination factor NusB [Parachlamydiales bacterium]
MSLPQQKFREIVFQLLFSYDLSRGDEEVLLPMLMAELCVSKKSVREAWLKMQCIWQDKNLLDKRISEISKEYALDRIQKVERNILRLAIFELLKDNSIPPKVAISEGMRLARKFSSPEAALYVNALLDTVYKESLGENVDATLIEAAAQELIESEAIVEDVVHPSLD